MKGKEGLVGQEEHSDVMTHDDEEPSNDTSSEVFFFVSGMFTSFACENKLHLRFYSDEQ